MILLALLSVFGVSSGSIEDPNMALSGVYSECVLGFDWTCLQRRTLLFVDRLSRAASYPLFPGLILVRTVPPGDPIEPSDLKELDGERIGEMVDDAAGAFFEEHVFRVQMPNWLKSEGRAMGHVDFFFGDGVEGRKKKKKKIKKLLKKVLLLALLLKVGKILLLIPLGLGLIKIAAIKGLLFGLISLIMSKVMLLQKLMKNKKMMMGGGGGGGWMDAGGGSSGSGGDSGWPSSGGGGGGGGGGSGGGGSGGWDRALAAHQLAYSSYDTKNSPT
ncbi:uncharacterized protein [Halyomorpha halys]|uniref:uncharacterized protein n=1 Tax=Halyomorpha halys TaxID=286706 RepID=UPI0034D1BF30